MTNKLSFNFLPHRREFLEFGIGSRLRQDFAYNSYVPLPKVRLFSPEEAKADGFDPDRGLGWFNFKTTEIGVLVFNNRSAPVAWQMATGVTVHEHLHWLWSLSPKTVGCQQESDRFVMNVFTDAANEQRAMMNSRWARKFLRRTRELLLPQAWAKNITEPLYMAGHMTLAVHTLLSVKGSRIIRRLHNSKKPENMAKELWKLCEQEFNRKIPEHALELWLKAFSLSLQAWTTDSDFTRFSIAQDFISLFPTPPDAPPESPLDMGGHRNDDCERDENPAGTTKSGKPLGSHKPPPADDGNPPDEPTSSQNSGKIEDSTDDLSKTQAENSPVEPEEKSAAESSSGNSSEGEAEISEPLVFDERTEMDKDQQLELEQLEQDVRELNRASEPMPGAIVKDSPSDKVFPADPRSLIGHTQGDAAALAERLRIVARPRSRVKDSRGRVVSRIVAHDSTALKPFRSRTASQKSFGPTVFVAFTSDTSGSMGCGLKAEAARRAAMTIHLACVKEKVVHLIATSRSLEMLCGTRISPEKSNTLIAGMQPHTTGGDNYIGNLPQIINLVRRRPEAVKILLVLTDGMPGDPTRIKEIIDDARRGGIIVIGIGLELTSSEENGMKSIFGEGADQTVLGRCEGFARLTAEVLSNAVTRGSRHIN